MERRTDGIFTVLGDRLLGNSDVAYDCDLDAGFAAVYVRAENAEDRNRMRGSKYIQSGM